MTSAANTVNKELILRFDVMEKDEQIKFVLQQTKKLTKQESELKVQSDDDLGTAVSIVKDIKESINLIETRRKSVVNPANKWKDDIQAAARTLTNPLTKIKDLIETKQLDYQTEKERIRQEAEQKELERIRKEEQKRREAEDRAAEARCQAAETKDLYRPFAQRQVPMFRGLW